MPKEEMSFETFMEAVSPEHQAFIRETHDALTAQGCTYKIETAKSGPVFSYLVPKTKKVLCNYVFRKAKMLVRLYGDHVGKYAGMLADLPSGMKRAIDKAGVCKRLEDPAKCNSRCPMGYVFDMDGKTYKNCRYGCFMFEVADAHYAALREFMECELKERLADGN